jgi:hypothetical protein
MDTFTTSGLNSPAYQYGPETPYRYATAELCRSVAAHVHVDETAAATRPDLTERPAVEKFSDVVWRAE